MKIEILDRGKIWVDGGAMFGIVPYVFWAKEYEPNEKNCIPLALNSLYIEIDSYKCMVDPGGGKSLGEEYEYQENQPLLEDLAALGVSPEEITHVILSHLHTDHMEGLFDSQGMFCFPQSQIVVSQKALEEALDPHPFVKDDYCMRWIEAISIWPHLKLIEGQTEILPGITFLPAPGHTQGHSILVIQEKEGEKKWYFFADLIPLTLHLKIPYISSFDLFPKETCDQKAKILELVNTGDYGIFFHDPKYPLVQFHRKDKELGFSPL